MFSGEITPEKYNQAWWELRQKYQGVAPPVARSESDFDPGAKYHVPANVPYTRYFLARHPPVPVPPGAGARRPAARSPLHRCSIYGTRRPAARLNAMLADGDEPARGRRRSRRSPGSDRWTRRAILDYFAPLQKWLDEQNKGKPVGW